MRRFAVLLLALFILVVAGWSLAWWYISGRVESEIDLALAGSAEGGIAIACAEREQSGFPFRFVTICTEATAQPATAEWTARLEGLQAGAWFYQPRQIEAVLGGPFELSADGLDQPVTSDWEHATAEIDAGSDGPRSVSAAFTNPVAQVQGIEVATDRTVYAVAPSQAGDGSRIAVEAVQLRLPGREAIPPADISIEAQTPIPPEALLGGEVDAANGVSVTDLELSVETSAIQAFAEGALDVGPDGVVDGTLTLHLVGIENLPELLAALPGQAGAAGNALVGALLALAAPAEWQGQPARRIVINIENGEVRAGTLPLGQLPPLWQAPASS